MLLYKHLTEATLIDLINTGYAVIEAIEAGHAPTISSMAYRKELVCIMYRYLKQYTITRELVPICKAILLPANIKTLRHIHQYNYYKLKFILNP